LTQDTVSPHESQHPCDPNRPTDRKSLPLVNAFPLGWRCYRPEPETPRSTSRPARDYRLFISSQRHLPIVLARVKMLPRLWAQNAQVKAPASDKMGSAGKQA
jgi:hypothetical protein